MTGSRPIVSFLILSCANAASAGPPPFGTVTTVQVAKGRSVQAATLADVDGDGAEDLVLATSRRGRRAERSIEVHLRRRDGDAFAQQPDLSLDVPDDATAFAVGDVHEDAGAEIVLFSASGAFAWRPKGPEDARVVRLAPASFLWQLADPREILLWKSGVRDLDGDGLADLVLPEPEGWRIALQRREKGAAANFASVSAPRLPAESVEGPEPAGARRMEVRAKRKELRVAVTLGGDDAQAARDFLVVSESVPAPQFLDWDADGRLDLLAQTSRELLVWRQRPDGSFAERPDGRHEIPVPADRERRLDVSYGAHAADLDGDRRADSVMLAGDRRSEDVRTQVLVYVQGRGGAGAEAAAAGAASPLFGANGVPCQLLRIGGFAGSAQLVDVDGDGRADLALGSIRVDGALDTAKAAASGALDGEIYVFRNRAGAAGRSGGPVFSDRPDLTFALSVKAEGLRKVRNEIVARFFGDVTGDGVRELLLRDEPERIRVMMTRRSGDGFAVVPQPLWETRVESGAKLAVHEGARGGSPELLVLEDAQVLHVRFP